MLVAFSLRIEGAQAGADQLRVNLRSPGGGDCCQHRFLIVGLGGECRQRQHRLLDAFGQHHLIIAQKYRARAAAQLALTGATDVVDVSDLGLDRFDSEGRSRLATDPIALPFPAEAEDAPART